MPWTFYNSNGQRLSSAATSINVLDIDGATDIGAAIVDADLFIIDDGASGTNRKTAASRLKTYIGGVTTGGTDNAILRADGTGGSTSQGSAVTIADTTGDITLPAAGQIFVGNGSAGDPSYTFICDPNTGAFTAGNDCFQIASNGVSDLIVANSNVHINDCANGKMDAGLSIQQLTADNEILALKSAPDVGHGMTSLTETDTMLAFAKGHACEGQIVLHAYSEGVVAMHTRGYATEPQTTDTTSSKGVLTFQAYKRSSCGTGTSNVQLASNENAFSVAGGSVNANFLIKGNGDLHGSDTSISSLDTHCDVGLIRAIETTKRTEGIIKSKWDDHVHENIDSLIDAGLYSVPPWEGGLLNLSQLWRLHNGAIWQLWTTIKDQGEEILGLRQQLTALEGK